MEPLLQQVVPYFDDVLSTKGITASSPEWWLWSGGFDAEVRFRLFQSVGESSCGGIQFNETDVEKASEEEQTQNAGGDQADELPVRRLALSIQSSNWDGFVGRWEERRRSRDVY